MADNHRNIRSLERRTTYRHSGYLGVFAVLVVGTILTYFVAHGRSGLDLSRGEYAVALADRVHQDDVRHAVFHARVVEPEA